MDATLAASAGDARAFLAVVDEIGPAVQAYFVRRAPAAAEDLLAATWLAAWSSRATYDPSRGSARGWMFGVARNILSRHWEQSAGRARGIAEDPLEAGASDPWEAVDARLDAAALGAPLRAALDGLAPVEREMLLLIAWEQLTPTEAAAVVGISPATARTRLFRARTRMREALLEGDEPGGHKPPEGDPPPLSASPKHPHPPVTVNEPRRTK